ncbi:MAG: HAD-IC family P-type ATPase [Actinomycetia bacterium]|nr:HAD-IC family P-type ATPase [Actinomycetes bacterium]
MAESTRAQLRGLTRAEVDRRLADGRGNEVAVAPVRTLGEIVRANVVTPVNGIVVTLFALILSTGFWRDSLFVVVVAANSAIGIVQELRARRELRRLAVLSAPRATVMRDGEAAELDIARIVEDDLLELAPGGQVVVDGEVILSEGLEVDESLLTGESERVEKEPGAGVRSGSFVSAGSGLYRATKVGAASYASELAEEARRFTLVNSELRNGINDVLRWLIFLIPPACAVLLVALLAAEETWRRALQGTVAAAAAMVPDGLVLLTSVAFLVGVVALARHRALAKELATVELLARVDVLCLDKTGTITTGEITLASVEPLREASPSLVEEALAALAASDPTPNATMQAIAARLGPTAWKALERERFSSARGWSASSFAGRGAFFLGAPDVLLREQDARERARASELAAGGLRVLVLARGDGLAGGGGGLVGGAPPPAREPLALVCLEDAVRPDVSGILAHFLGQGVTLKVISGDHPQTVAAVARRAGVPGADAGRDGQTLPAHQEGLASALAESSVFGRVTPQQKRAMVRALQARGHVVAMTGDGVNDVLALKDADMGIALGGGSAASRAVAQLVLLDNAFAALPKALAEGRKVMGNIERVSSLFVTKAAYAVLLALIVGIAHVEFPFLPRQLTLIGSFSIGVPGFFLALAPDAAAARAGFIGRVLRFSIPAGAAAAVATFAVYEIARRSPAVPLGEARTLATVTLLAIGLVVLLVVSRPLRAWKLVLAGLMAASYAGVMLAPPLRRFFELDPPPAWLWGPAALAVLLTGVLIVAIPRVVPGLRRVEQEGSAGGEGDGRA